MTTKFVIQRGYDIVKAHGGEMKVESIDGKQTICTIELKAIK